MAAGRRWLAATLALALAASAAVAAASPSPAPVPLSAPTPSSPSSPGPAHVVNAAPPPAPAPAPSGGSASVATAAVLASPPCPRPEALLNGLFDRDDPSSIFNAYMGLLAARYAYPTAFGVSSGADGALLTYQELFQRKWTALGATPGSFTFIDVDAPVPVLGLFTNHVEAHAVVFASRRDVFVAFRGLTNVESALTESARFAPTNGTFGSAGTSAGAFGGYLTVHSGFYSSFLAAWPRLPAAISAARARTVDPAGARVYLTGHSMGAALATFSAMRLLDAGERLGGVYLFGAPKMGQQPFVDAYAASGLDIITMHYWCAELCCMCSECVDVSTQTVAANCTP